MSEVSILGGTSLSDYFLGTGSAVQTPDIAVANFANSWVNESAFQSPVTKGVSEVFPAQPSILGTLGQSFKDVGSGLWQGATEVGQGIARQLPSTLLSGLASKMGLVSTPVKAENGKTVYYLTPSQAGVQPMAVPMSTTAGTATQVAGIATSTILVGIALAILAYLVLKSR